MACWMIVLLLLIAGAAEREVLALVAANHEIGLKLVIAATALLHSVIEIGH